MWGDTAQFELIANTPVEDGRIKAWHGCLVRAQGETITDEDREIARQTQAGALEAFATDFQIWRHKRPALKIMALKTDGPFKVGRSWYGQFYESRTEAAERVAPLNGIYHVPGVERPADRQHAIDDGLPI